MDSLTDKNKQTFQKILIEILIYTHIHRFELNNSAQMELSNDVIFYKLMKKLTLYMDN